MEQSVRLIQLKEVISRVSLRKTAIYDRIKQNEFPQPVSLGRRVAWVSAEIDGWINQQVKQRDMQAGGEQ